MNKRFVGSELQVWEEDLYPEEACGHREEEQGNEQMFVNTNSCHLKGSESQNKF